MPKKNSQMGTFGVLFYVLAGLVAFTGLGQLTQANYGVGLIGLACYLAVLSRIAQASHIANKFHKENEE